MYNPILDGLKNGERFSVRQLIDEYTAVKEYRDLWWENADINKIVRPHTVLGSDPQLEETVRKEFVDTETDSEFFSEFNIRLRDASCLRRGHRVPRIDYRNDLVRHVVQKGCRHEIPTLVFSGGGYGAGKTMTTDMLVEKGVLPLTPGSVKGVDYFKEYIPEYCILRKLFEGQASTIAQEECRLIAADVFDRMVEARMSFGWDSSMSNYNETVVRIEKAKNAGYKLTLVAVVTSVQNAIRQAMLRAKQTGRFPHPTKLAESHAGFSMYFKEYLKHFDTIYVYANEGAPNAHGAITPRLIVKKKTQDETLAILDEPLLSKFVSM